MYFPVIAYMFFVLAGMLGVASEVYGQNKRGPLPKTVSSSIGEINVEQLATLEYPWGMALLPDGRLLITEKPGRLRIWENGRLSKPLRGVPEVVYRGKDDQGGLLDVEIDPDFERNSLVYLSYVEASEQQSDAIRNTDDFRFGPMDSADNLIRGGVVARARLDGDRLRDVDIIWRQEPKTVGRGHFGNRLVFNRDGTLFITSGDRMRFEPAQSLTSNLGKVLRINADGSIPKDNPFAGKKDARGDIWSYGHRNTLAAAVDPSSGQLWTLEMGPLGGDELNLIGKGSNYGWPLVSNGDHYGRHGVSAQFTSIPGHLTGKEFQPPIRSWTPVISPSGATFYTGELFLGWNGNLLAGGLSSQALVRLKLDRDRVAIEERIDMQRRIRDVLQTPDGAILLIVDDAKGELLRLTPAETR